jgi:hypothetical protein
MSGVLHGPGEGKQVADRPVRMLNLMAPGGLEQYLKELAAALPADRPPDPEQMARIASKYDFEPA